MEHARKLRIKYRWTRRYERITYDERKEEMLVSEIDSKKQSYVCSKGTMTWIHGGDLLSRLSSEGWKIVQEQPF